MIVLIKAIQLILSLSFLVIIHEFGHFCFARLFGMRVEKFYLFFNPSFSLFRCKKIDGKWCFAFFASNEHPFEDNPDSTNTEWGIGWLPFGGYCKISGMIDESLDTEHLKQEPKPWEFRSKPAWQRFFVMAGGVTVNFIGALVIYSAIMYSWGNAYVEMSETQLEFSDTAKQFGFCDGDRILAIDGKKTGKFDENNLLSLLEAKEITVIRNVDTISLSLQSGLVKKVLREQQGFVSVFVPAVVDSVMPNAPAYNVLMHDDRFLQINGNEIITFADVQKSLNEKTGDTLNAKVLRGADTVNLALPLTAEGKIGFYVKNPLNVKTETFGFFESIPKGISYGIDKLTYYVRQMKFLFTKEGAESIGGFGAIGSMFPSFWDWHSFWETTAFLSIILAFMNVLPIPALDGGFILFLLFEIIFRRKPSDKFMINAQMVGMALLFTLLIYANGMDILRLFQ